MGNYSAAVSGGGSSLVNVFLAPETLQQLPVYYLIWTLFYMTIHIVWDARSTRTPALHFVHIGSKVGSLYNAVSFASSLLLLVGIFNEATRKLAGDTVAPILLAAISGLMVALSEMCPYKIERGLSAPSPRITQP